MSTPRSYGSFEGVEAPAAEPDNLEIGELLLHALGRHWLAIGCFTCLGIASGLFVGLSQPNQYMSVAKILVRLGQREQMTPESAIATDGWGRTTSFGLQDEMHLLTSPTLPKRVARKVGPDVVLQPYDPASADGPGTPWIYRKLHAFQSWWMKLSAPSLPEGAPTDSPKLVDAAALVLHANATITSEPVSNTITITYTAHSPDLAQEIAQAYLGVVRETHQEFFGGEHERTFVEELMASAIQEAKTAAEALSLRRKELGAFDIDSSLKAIVAEMEALRAQTDRDKIRIASIVKEIEVLTEQIGTTAPTVARSTVASEIANPRRELIYARLVALEDERDRLADDFAHDSDAYQARRERLDQRIAKVEEELLQTPNVLRSDPFLSAMVPNPQYEALLARRSALEQEREGLRIAREMREETLRLRQADLQNLVTLQPEFDTLQQAVVQANGRLNEMSFAHSRAMILADIARDEQMSNLKVVHEATLPVSKVSPQRGKILAIGTMAGLFFGFALSVIRILLDSRLRYPSTIEQLLGVRVLGVIREEPRWSRFEKEPSATIS